MNLDIKSKAIIVAFIVAVLALGVGVVGAESWSPREGCAHRVVKNDTMYGLSQRYGVDMETIMMNTPLIEHRDHIERGWLLDVCPGGLSTQTAATIRPTGLEGRVLSWAEDVIETRPTWATDHDVRFMIAVAGPESQFCHPRWSLNRGDANPPVWGPSTGCVQVRTFLRAAELRAEPHRDRQWLETDQRNVAEAAWIIHGQPGTRGAQGKTAWGPARHAPGIGVKLPPSGDCRNAHDPVQCRQWWQIADAAIQHLEGQR